MKENTYEMISHEMKYIVNWTPGRLESVLQKCVNRLNKYAS